jgi:hypothetical protein
MKTHARLLRGIFSAVLALGSAAIHAADAGTCLNVDNKSLPG